jgi:hypothetical protein
MTATLLPNAKQQFLDSNGRPLAGGTVYFYIPNTSTFKNTWQDAGETVLNTNPVVLDANGQAIIYGDGQYRQVVNDVHGNLIWDKLTSSYVSQSDLSSTTDPASGAGSIGFNYSLSYAAGTVGKWLKDLATSVGSSFIGFIQVGVGAVLRTVQDKLRDTVSVKDFGAKGDGVTDDTAAIQAAFTAGAGRRVYIPGTTASYLISDVINVSSDTTIYGDGEKSLLKLTNGNKSGIFGTGVNNVKVADIGILCQSAGTTAYIGGVYFFNSQKCRVDNVEFVGMSWAGVLINNSSRCSVVGCRFSGWLGTIQDSADINIYQNSNFNFVSGNQCYGSGDHGIAIYDPYTNTNPTGNIVTGNVVDQHNAYGILEYIGLSATQPYNTRTVISNNVISNILGSGIAGTSGAGIYIQAGGGTIVTGNSVYNCCRSTTNFDTLAMAGISYQIGETATGLEVEGIVADNIVHMLRGPCIFLSASNRTISADNNTLKSTGTTNVRGEALIVQNCNAVRLTNNTVRHENPNFYAVKLVAITNEYSGHSLSGNTVTCVNSAGGFLVTTTSGGSINNMIMANNTVFGSLSNPAYSVQNVGNLRFIGNHGDSSGVVFSMLNCPRARLSDNRFHSSSAAYAILFQGANTNAWADDSNDFDGWVENDAGNGMKITLTGTGAPAVTGSWDVGDTVINRAPSAGGIERWRCTAAGSPGTWTSLTLN